MQRIREGSDSNRQLEVTIMSTTTAVAPPITNEIPHVPERLYSVERAKFAENFNRRPLYSDHSLSSHPAFTAIKYVTSFA